VYSLDEPEALAAARRAVAVAPDEPAAHRALANVLWLAILYRRGAVFTDIYLSGSFKDQANLPKPSAELDAEFKQALGRAMSLAEARLKAAPTDVQAHFDAGAAWALQASYTATVEGKVLGAMRLAKRAFDAQEFVLEHAPERVEAGLVAGTYRYLVASMPLPVRMMAYVVGFGGGKARGIALIEGATNSRESRVDARLALMLIYQRERRFADAARIARELQTEFPRNRLLILEEGSAWARAGRAAEAEAIFTRGLAVHDQDGRTKVPGERAIWLYKRAAARIAQRRLAEAQTDLDAARQGAPSEWAQGRLHLETGRLADLRGRRPEALASYRQAQLLCARGNDIGGFLAFCVLGLLLVAGAGVYYVSRHISMQQMSSPTALRTFDEARGRFEGGQPLIEVDNLERARETRPIAQLPTSPVKPTEMRILAWDPEDQQLAQITLPFWLLRFGRQRIEVLDRREGFDLEQMPFDVPELERIGPALVLDHRSPDGERVLIWTQ
jgi:tetratricopeptide (TPR) repeat protein